MLHALPRFFLRSRERDLSGGGDDTPLIGAHDGSVHIGITAREAPADEAPMVHAFDKAIYVISGQVSLRREGQRIQMPQGSYALVCAGQRHRLETLEGAAKWIEICAPQPRNELNAEPDTIKLPGWPLAKCEEMVAGDPEAGGCGRFDGRMPLPIDNLPELCGVSVRMLLDVPQGAVHFNLFVVDFQQGALCDHHDHPFEEAYFMLSGEVELTVQGQRHTLRAGDFAWMGVGAGHAFRANGPARWIEVQAPLPPVRDGMRWHAPWRLMFSSLLAP